MKSQRATERAEPSGSTETPIHSTLPTHLPKFRRIVESFLAKLPDELENMHSSLNIRDWESLARQAHWLKGCGGTVGFECLTATAADVEQCAKSQDVPAAEDCLNALDQLASRITSFNP